MSRISGAAGLGPINEGWDKPTDSRVTTVQAGESKLPQVAQRLGITDLDSLRDANPHISDTNNLKVGQEIRLPQRLASQPQDSEPVSDSTTTSGATRPPIGDPLSRAAIQARFSAADLSQVQGGAQQLRNPRAAEKSMKWVNKMTHDIAADKQIPAGEVAYKYIPVGEVAVETTNASKDNPALNLDAQSQQINRDAVTQNIPFDLETNKAS